MATGARGWQQSATLGVLEGRARTTGQLKRTGSAADPVFGSNSHLRALAEVYASSDAHGAFMRAVVRDFVAAWGKLMNLDYFGPDARPPGQ